MEGILLKTAMLGPLGSVTGFMRGGGALLRFTASNALVLEWQTSMTWKHDCTL